MSASDREPSQMYGNGPESCQDVQEWLRRPPECPSVVEMPSRMSGCGLEDIPDVPEWSGGPIGCLGWSQRPSG